MKHILFLSRKTKKTYGTTSFFFKMLLFLIVFGITEKINAQTTPEDIGPSSYEVQLIPASPDVADLGKFGSIPVNKYNGTANIGIPIHQVNFEGLSIPLSLNYNTSGVRVSQEASWVGLGWSLSDGVVITRQINGFDDLRSTLLNNGGFEEAQSVGWIHAPDYVSNTGAPDYDFLVTGDDLSFLDNQYSANNPYDTEPDLFKVNLPGGSFKFYLPKIQGGEQVLTATVVDARNYKVLYTIADETFQVTDPDGFTYFFDVKEYSTGYGSWDAAAGNLDETVALQAMPGWSTNQTRKLNSAWKVSKIASYTGKELNFSYQEAFFMSFPGFRETYSFPIHSDHRNENPMGEVKDITNPSNVSAFINAFHNVYLTGISGDFGSVTFNLSDRMDLFSPEAKARFADQPEWYPAVQPHQYNAKKLESIEVKNNNDEVVKTAQLYYAYFNNHKINDYYKERYLRLKLTGVAVSGQNYSFQYDNPDALPAKDTKSTDFWGFYNGVANTIRVPSYNRFFLALPFNTNSDQIFEDYYKLNGAIRKSDITYGRYGILSRVTYPTGGYTDFEYEGNSVTLKRLSYSPLFFEDGSFASSGISNSEDYNFSYQQLKLANDPSYALVDYNTCEVTTNNVFASNEAFEITDDNVCDRSYNIKVTATLSCSVGCGQGINPAGPAVWIENTQTGEVFDVFSYNGHFGVNNSSVDLEKEITLPVGQYVFKYSAWSVNQPFLVVATASAYATIWQDAEVNTTDVFEEFEVGGARLHQITNRSAGGQFIDARRFTYNHIVSDSLISSSGKLMDDLVYGSKGFGFHEYTPEHYTAPNSGDSSNSAVIHSENMVRTNPSASGSHIGYSQVTQISIDSLGNNNGSIVTRYKNQPNQYKTRFIGTTPAVFYVCLEGNLSCVGGLYGESFDPDDLAYFNVSYGDVYILGMLPTMYDYMNGSVLEETVKDAAGQLKTQTVNTYQEYTGGVAPAGNGHFPVLLWTGELFPITNPYELFASGDLKNNKLLRIKTTTTTSYQNSGETTKEISYYYDNASHYKLTRMISTDSKGKTITTRAFYPQDLNADPFMNDLIAQNRFNAQIRSETYKGTPADPEQTLLRVQYTGYNNNTSPNGLVLPAEVRTVKGGPGNEEQRQVYEKYDGEGKLLQYRKTEGTPVSYIWGYWNSKPIAKLEGVPYTNIDPATIDNLQLLSENDQNSTSEQTLRDALDTLRSSHPGAMITTFTYDPLVGVTSITDYKGYVTFYFYDNFNRLEAVKDAQDNIIESYRYNYANQAIPSESLIAGISYGSSSDDHQWFSAGAGGGSGDYSYSWYEGIGTSSTDFEGTPSGSGSTYQLMVACDAVKHLKLVVTDNVTGEIAQQTKVNNNACGYEPLTGDIAYGTHTNTYQNFAALISGGSGNFTYGWFNGIGGASTDFEGTASGNGDTYQLMVNCTDTKYVKLVVTDNVTGETFEQAKVNNNTCNYPPLNVSINYGPHNDNAQNFTSNVSGGSGDYSYSWHKGVGTSSLNFELTSTSTFPNCVLIVACTTYQWVKLVITDNITGETVYAKKKSNNNPCSGGGPQPIEPDPFDPEQ